MAKKQATLRKTAPAPDRAAVHRARRVYRKLAAAYPDARCALDHRDPYELLMATILSAQCTDERVNKTTPALFEKYPTARDLAASEQEDVEAIVRSCGFYRNKARSLRGAAAAIASEHGGKVPADMDELLTLPGVARKTANVVLGNAYNINEGVVVDTHVKRIAHRLGFTQHTNPEKVERDLMPLFPRKNWSMLSHLLIFHGRRTCIARKPDCPHCPVQRDCPKIGVAG